MASCTRRLRRPAISVICTLTKWPFRSVPVVVVRSAFFSSPRLSFIRPTNPGHGCRPPLTPGKDTLELTSSTTGPAWPRAAPAC